MFDLLNEIHRNLNLSLNLREHNEFTANENKDARPSKFKFCSRLIDLYQNTRLSDYFNQLAASFRQFDSQQTNRNVSVEAARVEQIRTENRTENSLPNVHNQSRDH